jgi:steroid delta-isomerase-like uncharacterized protein
MGSARSIVDEGNRAFNDHDIEGLLRLYSSDAEVRAPGQVARTSEEIRQFTNAWLQGFPDAKIEVVNVIEAGDVLVEEGICRGTHTGSFPTPMGDIPPTGKSVEGPFVDIFEIRDGKVVSDRLTFDRLQLMEQLGLMPQPAGATAG